MSEIPFPDEPAVHDDRTPAPSRMTPGAFARDPDRFGPPFKPTSDDPKVLVSAGPALTILVHACQHTPTMCAGCACIPTDGG